MPVTPGLAPNASSSHPISGIKLPAIPALGDPSAIPGTPGNTAANVTTPMRPGQGAIPQINPDTELRGGPKPQMVQKPLQGILGPQVNPLDKQGQWAYPLLAYQQQPLGYQPRLPGPLGLLLEDANRDISGNSHSQAKAGRSIPVRPEPERMDASGVSKASYDNSTPSGAPEAPVLSSPPEAGWPAAIAKAKPVAGAGAKAAHTSVPALLGPPTSSLLGPPPGGQRQSEAGGGGRGAKAAQALPPALLKPYASNEDPPDTSTQLIPPSWSALCGKMGQAPNSPILRSTPRMPVLPTGLFKSSDVLPPPPPPPHEHVPLLAPGESPLSPEAPKANPTPPPAAPALGGLGTPLAARPEGGSLAPQTPPGAEPQHPMPFNAGLLGSGPSFTDMVGSQAHAEAQQRELQAAPNDPQYQAYRSAVMAGQSVKPMLAGVPGTVNGQFHSDSGITPEQQANYDRILRASGEPQAALAAKPIIDQQPPGMPSGHRAIVESPLLSSVVDNAYSSTVAPLVNTVARAGQLGRQVYNGDDLSLNAPDPAAAGNQRLPGGVGAAALDLAGSTVLPLGGLNPISAATGVAASTGAGTGYDMAGGTDPTTKGLLMAGSGLAGGIVTSGVQRAIQGIRAGVPASVPKPVVPEPSYASRSPATPSVAGEVPVGPSAAQGLFETPAANSLGAETVGAAAPAAAEAGAAARAGPGVLRTLFPARPDVGWARQGISRLGDAMNVATTKGLTEPLRQSSSRFLQGAGYLADAATMPGRYMTGFQPFANFLRGVGTRSGSWGELAGRMAAGGQAATTGTAVATALTHGADALDKNRPLLANPVLGGLYHTAGGLYNLATGRNPLAGTGSTISDAYGGLYDNTLHPIGREADAVASPFFRHVADTYRAAGPGGVAMHAMGPDGLVAKAYNAAATPVSNWAKGQGAVAVQQTAQATGDPNSAAELGQTAQELAPGSPQQPSFDHLAPVQDPKAQMKALDFQANDPSLPPEARGPALARLQEMQSQHPELTPISTTHPITHQDAGFATPQAHRAWLDTIEAEHGHPLGQTSEAALAAANSHPGKADWEANKSTPAAQEYSSLKQRSDTLNQRVHEANIGQMKVVAGQDERQVMPMLENLASKAANGTATQPEMDYLAQKVESVADRRMKIAMNTVVPAESQATAADAYKALKTNDAARTQMEQIAHAQAVKAAGGAMVDPQMTESLLGGMSDQAKMLLYGGLGLGAVALMGSIAGFDPGLMGLMGVLGLAGGMYGAGGGDLSGGFSLPGLASRISNVFSGNWMGGQKVPPQALHVPAQAVPGQQPAAPNTAWHAPVAQFLGVPPQTVAAAENPQDQSGARKQLGQALINKYNDPTQREQLKATIASIPGPMRQQVAAFIRDNPLKVQIEAGHPFDSSYAGNLAQFVQPD